MSKKKLFIFLDSQNLGGSEIDILNLSNLLQLDFDITFIMSASQTEFLMNFKDFNIIHCPPAVLFSDLLPAFFFIVRNHQIFLDDSRVLFWCHHFDSNRIFQIFNFVKRRKSTIAYRLTPDYQLFFQGRKTAKKVFTIFQSKYRFVFCGKSMKNNFDKYFFKNFNTSVINNGRNIDKHCIDNKKIGENQRVNDYIHEIVVVSRISKIKRVEIVIEAIIQLLKIRYDFRLTIVGDGENLDEIKKLVKFHRLEKVVRCLGFQKNVSHVLNMSTIYVSASAWEGMPGSVIEAMISGCLTICSNIPPHVELLGNGTLGLLFELDSAFDLYNKLMQAMDMGNQMRGQILNDAFNMVKSNYNINIQLELWKRHISEM
jgi:glycosyltransferase involved in cell wall biosynthesis